MIVAQIPLLDGRGRNEPKMVVVHAMAEFVEQGNRDLPAWDLLAKLDLSAHAFVTPSGVVVRSRDDDQGAWHAKGFNRDSLGIEFLVPGVHTYSTFLKRMKEPYLSDAQYAAGVELVREWVRRYEISPDQVVRHSDVDPGRKHDPGDGFPWKRFVEEVFADG